MRNAFEPMVLVRELAMMQHGAVTTRQAADCGVSRFAASRACERRDLVHVRRGVYGVPDLVDEWTVFAAGCLVRPDATLSLFAAAKYWNFDGLEWTRLDMSVPKSTGSQHRWLHRSGDLAPFEVESHGVLRVTEVTRTLIDYAGLVDADHVERALESVLRRGLTSIARIEWRLGVLKRSGRRGPAVMRAVLDRRPVNAPATGSDLETRALQVIRAAGIAEPVRQHKVYMSGGRVAFLDLAWPPVKAFTEVDGYASHSSREAFRRDRRRQNGVVVLGWAPLRFTEADAKDPTQFVADLRTLLAREGAA